MTDSLHTRIAAVQREHRLNSFGANYVQCECGWKSPEKYATWTDHPEHVADAVIRELDEAIPPIVATGGSNHMSRNIRHFPELSLYAFSSGLYCDCGLYFESDCIGDEPGHLATERVQDMWAEHIKGQGQ